MKHAPKSLDHLLSVNSEQLTQRIKMGDVLERPRPIEHTAVFPKRDLATAWVLRIRDEGYEARTERAGFTGARVTATMESSLEGDRADEFVTELYEQIAEAGGNYQGWDAPVILG
jgi:hypothetical protein